MLSRKQAQNEKVVKCRDRGSHNGFSVVASNTFSLHEHRQVAMRNDERTCGYL
nr:MAG TPA: hypothetical protein [Caudoviricetes sp.]